MKCTTEVLRSFTVAKVFRENNDRVNSLSYSANGELLISSSDDDSIVVYDCTSGVQKNTQNSKKYGCDLVKYTHAANAVIHASTKVRHGWVNNILLLFCFQGLLVHSRF